MTKAIAFFDFDGTISTKDSLIDFIKFSVGRKRYYAGLIRLSPDLIAYTFKLLSNHIAKERMVSFFFKGWKANKFQAIANRYSQTKIDTIICKQALKKIKWHQAQGHAVVVVSASMELWLHLWCKNNHLELLATQLEVIDDRITGKFKGKNCHGEEKVNRIKLAYDLSLYDQIYAYGDSTGDKPMLSLADQSYYRCYE